MTNVVNLFGPKTQFPTKEPIIPTAPETNLHIKEAESYCLSDVAIGIEIAIHITRDKDTAKFLIKKMEQAINQNQIWVSFTLHETRKYLDYLDIVNSKVHKDWRIAVGKFKYCG